MGDSLKLFKNNKKDVINIVILICLIFLIIMTVLNSNNLFGSMKDWVSQHVQFADYLRTLFYDSHNLFPSFAFNLGAGENIYNISYYGLYNPIILFSYLLPFVDMITYIQISSILCVIISTVLLYFFIRKKYDTKISLIAGIIFLMAGCLIFHAHRHIMFINYFPFLLMAFYGIDKYFTDSKKGFLIISIFLMILTSYYFSVVGILSLSLYGVYKCLEVNKGITLKEFFKEALKYIGIIIIPILMACILLLPTMYAMLDGRAETNSEVSILSLLVPTFSTQYLLYTAYTLGISAIGILGIIAAYFSKKKENIVLAIILTIIFVFPIFNYLCNGGMYLNGKAFIPLLPLMIILICDFLNDFKDKKSNILIIVLISLIVAILNVLYFYLTGEKELLLFVIDMTVLVIILLICYKFKINIILYIYIVLVSLIIVLSSNYHDEYVTKEKYNSFNYEETEENVKEVLETDNSFYRMADESVKIDKANHIYDSEYYTGSIYSSLTNNDYKKFYTNLIYNEFIYRNSFMLSSTDNIFYNFYMGNKYLFNLSADIMGYEKISDNVYKNEDVMPIGYTTNKVMSLEEYKRLDKREQLDAYLNYAIINEDTGDVYDKKVEEVTPKYNVSKTEGLEIEENDGKYNIKAKKDNELVIDLDEDMTGKIILIDFKMNYDNHCNKDDSYITINGMTNKLTCQEWKYHNKNYEFEYAVSGNDLNELIINFSKGKFKIDNLNINVYDYNDLIELRESVTEFKIDREKTKGDYIYGSINNKERSFFKLSIPYDKGFEILVDGKEVDYQKVNLSFIGFWLDEGNHDIVIKYTAPLFKESLVISVIGVIIFIAVLMFDWRKRKQEA